MSVRNGTEENRKVARGAAGHQTESLEAIEHFEDIADIYKLGFEDGAVWIADFIEPTRQHVNQGALGVTWQTLVIFRDIALEKSDFERVSFLSAAIQDIATLIETQGHDMPKIHDDRDNEVIDEDVDDDSDGDHLEEDADDFEKETAEVVDTEEWVSSLSPEEYQNYLENKADL